MKNAGLGAQRLTFLMSRKFISVAGSFLEVDQILKKKSYNLDRLLIQMGLTPSESDLTIITDISHLKSH